MYTSSFGDASFSSTSVGSSCSGISVLATASANLFSTFSLIISIVTFLIIIPNLSLIAWVSIPSYTCLPITLINSSDGSSNSLISSFLIRFLYFKSSARVTISSMSKFFLMNFSSSFISFFVRFNRLMSKNGFSAIRLLSSPVVKNLYSIPLVSIPICMSVIEKYLYNWEIWSFVKGLLTCLHSMNITGWFSSSMAISTFSPCFVPTSAVYSAFTSAGFVESYPSMRRNGIINAIFVVSSLSICSSFEFISLQNCFTSFSKDIRLHQLYIFF